MVMGQLRALGYYVTHSRVCQVIHDTDLINRALRWGSNLRVRRQYSVPGPNSLWHIGILYYATYKTCCAPIEYVFRCSFVVLHLHKTGNIAKLHIHCYIHCWNNGYAIIWTTGYKSKHPIIYISHPQNVHLGFVCGYQQDGGRGGKGFMYCFCNISLFLCVSLADGHHKLVRWQFVTHTGVNTVG